MSEQTFSQYFGTIPGPYIRVRAESLISAGGVSTGNVGIVGTFDVDGEDAENEGSRRGALGETHLLGGFEDALEIFGIYDEYQPFSGTPEGADVEATTAAVELADSLGVDLTAVEGSGEGGQILKSDVESAADELGGSYNLVRSIELLYKNGASTVYARGVEPSVVGTSAYEEAFQELLKEDVDILLAPELSTEDATTVLGSVAGQAEDEKTDLIAVVGSDRGPKAGASAIAEQSPDHKRIVFTAPGIRVNDARKARRLQNEGKQGDPEVTLNGRYSAAAVAGLLSSLAPQTSPTHKALPGVGELERRFRTVDQQVLLQGGVMALEEVSGARVIRGITSQQKSGGPYSQVTTRRIVNYAKAGIRQVADPFIGRLNNARVRKALQGAVDGFLNNMVQNEALTEYQLSVSATRQDEIEGKARVNVVMQPTFSIDFIAVTLTLQ